MYGMNMPNKRKDGLSVQDYARGIIDTAYKADQKAMNPAPKPTFVGNNDRQVTTLSLPGALPGESLGEYAKRTEANLAKSMQEHNARIKKMQADANAKTPWPSVSKFSNQNNVISLRPGAGVNPTQSTYGFSSMQPSNNAGMLYRIDQYGKKVYL